VADVLDRPERPVASSRRQPRETLELLLDDLMRVLSFEKALVLPYDEERAALVGSFGVGVSDAAVRELVVPIARGDDPIASVLRTGLPQRVRDATTDERLRPEVRDALARMGVGPLVARVAPRGSGSAPRGRAGGNGRAWCCSRGSRE